MIMIIAIIYIFYHIFLSTVENYFQKILRTPPLKKSTLPLSSKCPFFNSNSTDMNTTLSLKKNADLDFLGFA